MGGYVAIPAIGASKWQLSGMLSFVYYQTLFAIKGFSAAFFITVVVQLFGMDVSFVCFPTRSCSIPAKKYPDSEQTIFEV